MYFHIFVIYYNTLEFIKILNPQKTSKNLKKPQKTSKNLKIYQNTSEN